MFNWFGRRRFVVLGRFEKVAGVFEFLDVLRRAQVSNEALVEDTITTLCFKNIGLLQNPESEDGIQAQIRVQLQSGQLKGIEELVKKFEGKQYSTLLGHFDYLNHYEIPSKLYEELEEAGGEGTKGYRTSTTFIKTNSKYKNGDINLEGIELTMSNDENDVETLKKNLVCYLIY